MPGKRTIPRVCETCGADFLAAASSVAAGNGRFCSKACFGRSCRTALERTCERCGSAFTVIPSEIAKGKGRLCSRACADAALVTPLLERIRQHTDVRGPDDCWPWLAKRNPRGYGETGDRGKYLRVTRVLLEQKIGRPLAREELALHSCSNPPCCNPAHLFVGDHQRNMDQRRAEGNYANGERHHAAKITADIVRSIRSRVGQGEPAMRLAREYDIAHSTVRRIVNRQVWTHVS